MYMYVCRYMYLYVSAHKQGRHQGIWLGVTKLFDAALPSYTTSPEKVGGGGVLQHIFFRLDFFFLQHFYI